MRKLFFVLSLTALAILPAFAGGQRSGGQTAADQKLEVTWFHAQLNLPNITYFNDALWLQELGKRHNITINVQGPVGGSYSEAVNVLFASGDLPDIIGNYNLNGYNGGIDAAIQDGVVLNFGAKPEYLKLVPNWKRMIDGNDNIRRLVTLDDGTIPIFCHIEENIDRAAWLGIAIREDWLKRLNLAVPTTIDELYAVARAFKTRDANGNGDPNDEVPIASGGDVYNALLAAFGLRRNTWYPDPANPGKATHWTLYKNGQAYTQALTTLAQWYKEGLLDVDFLVQSSDARNAKITGDKAGVFHTYLSGFRDNREAIKEYLKQQHYGNPDQVRVIALPNLKGPDNRPYSFNNDRVNWAKPSEATFITAAAEKRGKATRILPMIDYLYSPEGYELINFGVEGISFTRNADGTHRWTDLVARDPNYSLSNKVSEYALPFWGGWPKIMSYEAWKLNDLADSDAEAAHSVWIKDDTGICAPGFQLNAKDSADLARIMADANTAIDEFTSQVLTGQRPVSEIPAFLQRLDGMGITQAQQIYQRAYDGYLKK
jgi:putative aldouronate transport system substrate-binding protein